MTPLARAWSAYLDVLMDLTLEDGTPVLWFILQANPALAKRLEEALAS